MEEREGGKGGEDIGRRMREVVAGRQKYWEWERCSGWGCNLKGKSFGGLKGIYIERVI